MIMAKTGELQHDGKHQLMVEQQADYDRSDE